MPIYIKTEKFTDKTLELPNSERKIFLLMHKEWVKNIRESGYYIHSGYLINEQKIPGGGGLLIIEARDFSTAKKSSQTHRNIRNHQNDFLMHWEASRMIPDRF